MSAATSKWCNISEHAVLREDNARLMREVRAQVQQNGELRAEHARLMAHVAALVQALRDAAEWGTLEREFYMQDSDGDRLAERVHALLAAPDLAALAAAMPRKET